MEKVKPVLPPKPKCSSPSHPGQGNRSASGSPVQSTSSSSVVVGAFVARDELDGSTSAEEGLTNGKPTHVTTSLSMDEICHGEAKHEADEVRRQRPRTAPKPNSRIKTDFEEETKSASSSMISGLVIADALSVVDGTDSDNSLADCKAGKVSVIVADLKHKHSLIVVSNKQPKPIPVKPPRPKKAQRQATLCAGDAVDNTIEFPRAGERENEEHVDEKKKSRRLNSETKPKPKLFVNVQESKDSSLERHGSSPASADSGRLYRSASYERALEDDIFNSGITEDKHLKENAEEKEKKGKRQKTVTVVSGVRTSVSDTDIGGNYPDIVKDVTVVASERVLGKNIKDSPQGDRKGNGNIQPIRVAPPPPSKTNAPLLKRIPKDSGVKGDAPDYIDLQSKSLQDSIVKRSSSDCIGKKSVPTGKSSQSKQKPRKKSGDGERGKGETGRQSESVFYVNLGDTTNGRNGKSLTSDEAPPGERTVCVDADDYLMPVHDSHDVGASEGNAASSDSFYQNVHAASPKSKTKTPSVNSLDTVIPPPGKTLEPVEQIEPDNISINTYYEINDLDLQVQIQDGAMDDEGYSMIVDNNGTKEDNGEDADSDYIYPENWTKDSRSSRSSDAYIYPTDEAGNAFSPKSAPAAVGERSAVAVVRPRAKSELSTMSNKESDSRPSSWVCDSTFQSGGSNLSRNSSALSNSAFQMDDSPGELTEEDIKRNEEKRRRKAFLTAQEIVTSEKTFVDVLRLLSQDFIAAVNQASASLGKPVVPSSILNQIIKYLPELQKFNEELLEDLTSRLKNWDRDPRVADIFVKKGAFLKLYTNYIREFNSMVALLDENRRKNPDFDRAVTDFEASHCAKLALKHYMLKPIQRIPQYRLLLTDYRKQLTVDSPDFKDANTAILIVNEVAEHANESMKYGDILNKLLDIQNSLIGQFEVIVPGRTLLKEGILMKLSRKEMQPRMFYLFTDVLLYTTPVGSGYKLNNVLSLNTMKVSAPTKEDFQNEFSIISTQRSFTVSARTEQEKVEWLAAMSEAISSIRMKRTSYKGKHHLPSIVSIDLDPMDFKLGTKAPVWIPDDRVSMCMVCKQEFSMLFRRHHCRGCGKVVCSSCSSYEAPLRYLQYKPERVCSECYVTLNKMTDEMDETITEDDTTSSQGDQVGDSNRFTKRSIKNQFRSFAAADKESPKYVPPKRPAVLQEVNANDENAEMSGYLHLWKDRKWKKTWFVLKEKVLYTFKASEDAAAEKSTPLLGYEITPFNTYFQGVEPNLIFELCHRGMPSIIFKTESPQSRDRWMSAMRSATMP